jgi:hypothetical protein
MKTYKKTKQHRKNITRKVKKTIKKYKQNGGELYNNRNFIEQQKNTNVNVEWKDNDYDNLKERLQTLDLNQLKKLKTKYLKEVELNYDNKNGWFLKIITSIIDSKFPNYTHQLIQNTQSLVSNLESTESNTSANTTNNTEREERKERRRRNKVF